MERDRLYAVGMLIVNELFKPSPKSGGGKSHEETRGPESLRMNWREDIFDAWNWGLRAAAPAQR
jgi:hypothetical protein